jgi:hypothetical protein
LGNLGKRGVMVAAAGAAAAAGLFLAQAVASHAPPDAAPARPAAPAMRALGVADAPVTSAMPVGVAMAVPPAKRAAERSPGTPDAAALAPASKSAVVAALVRSGRPEEAYAAYKLLAACAFAQAFERVDDGEGDAQVRAHLATLQEACGDLSPGQLGNRVRLLEAAVAAHVQGAAADLVSQGPDGQPVADVWDDPAYAEWKRQELDAVKAEAARGDAAALLVMNAQYDHGGMLDAEAGALAIRYWVAYADVTLATDPRYADEHSRRAFEEDTARIVARYGAALSASQTEAAVAAGHAFVANRDVP